MRIEVYEREADAVEAAADAAAARIVAAGDDAIVGLPGGRRGRAVLAALGAHGEIPWASTRWFATDETCGDGAGRDSARELVMATALAPNRAPASALSVPDRTAAPADAARRWEADVRAAVEGRGGFDVLLLAVAPDGGVAGLAPGGTAGGWVVAGDDGRVSIGADALASARTIVVVATGASVEPAVRRALGDAPDPGVRPLERVLPDDGRVTWFADRAAVAGLLEGARVVEA